MPPCECGTLQSVPMNSVAPVGIAVRVERGDASQVDLSTATAAFFVVRRPDGIEKSWTATIVSAQATYVTLRYALAAVDLPIAGVYSLRAFLTLPGGSYPGESAEFEVTGCAVRAPLAPGAGALVYPVDLTVTLLGGESC